MVVVPVIMAVNMIVVIAIVMITMVMMLDHKNEGEKNIKKSHFLYANIARSIGIHSQHP